VGARRAAGGGATYLRRTADVERGGADEDDVSHLGAAEVVDGEADAGNPAEARRHVRAHAGQALRHQRRHAAVEHLERLRCGHQNRSNDERTHSIDRSMDVRTWQHLGVTGSRPVTCDGDTSSIWKPMECSTGSSSAVLFGGG
jgi:Zn ribbon nucleic-acid-binding protein